MKRFFILASAAIVALASCAKTEVVYKDAPEEIAFKQITNVMTKADALGDQGHTDMMVSAFDESQAKLWAAPFAKTSTANTWVATPAKYWPLTGSLNFVYYAPSAVDAVAGYVDGGYTLTAELDNETDFLYGTTVKNASKTNGVIPVDLRHALAKIQVSVTSDLAGLTIVSLQVRDVYQEGVLTVNYKTVDDNGTAADEKLDFDFTDITPSPISFEELENQVTVKDETYNSYCYVMPSVQTALVLTYKLPDSSLPLTYTHDLSSSGNWNDGHKYIYDFSIGANEIKFNPTALEWGTGADEDMTVVPQPLS